MKKLDGREYEMVHIHVWDKNVEYICSPTYGFAIPKGCSMKTLTHNAILNGKL